jgi:hypothetical protein
LRPVISVLAMLRGQHCIVEQESNRELSRCDV